MPRLSLVMPYYRNSQMLQKHLAVWRLEWSWSVKRAVEIVIVDDGSPVEPASDVLAIDRAELPAISLYRVTEDRPWHQHGARNLGAHVASAPHLLMTDVDHVVPASTMDEVLRALPLGSREVLTFGRVDAPEAPVWNSAAWPQFKRTRRDDGALKPHVNSFALRREHYWAIGGYDEDYCGIYGTDKDFRRRLFVEGTRVRHLDDHPLIRVAREVIPDASTRDVERKAGGRAAAKRAVFHRKVAQGRFGKTTVLNFPWERVI